jgi:preprotein translocase subunit Sec63
MNAYLLFGLVACARPFCYDVLLGFGVCGKGKGYAGKGCSLDSQDVCQCCRRFSRTKSMPTMS